MSLPAANPSEGPDLILQTRDNALAEPAARPALLRFLTSRLFLGTLASAFLLLLILAPAGFFYARRWVRASVQNSLPRIDGSIAIPGLTAAVTVGRDAHGVPHIRAASIDDLVLAQGFVTAQDRLFQMDLLRRHAAGELAEILGASLLNHDRLQRTLQIRASADRAIAQLPAAQLHLLERYAAGVNASIATQSAHLPIEFKLLRYQPAPWTPRDSILVALAMFQDLTNTFPAKLARESLTARLPPGDREQLEQDLYPVGSWRDHAPADPIPDLTIEGPPIEDVPLDESQWSAIPPSATPYTLSPAPSLFPGSNNWVVSGAHTASGKPLLSNDMHLSQTLPGIWYEADLYADQFHAAGVSLPGLPLIVVGHNGNIAWGFTNLGADVQDIYVETTRGSGANEEFLSTDGAWQPVVHISEPIRLHSGKSIPFEVLATRHGGTLTPILNPVLTSDVTAPNKHPRTLALRWTLYDPDVVKLPILDVNSAHDWPTLLAAFAQWGGPAQNVVYADEQGHIGFHAIGKVPLRDDLSPIPLAPNEKTEWSGYIPFDDMPQVFDPPSGVIATANSRTATGNDPPITLDWAAPYRNDRIWHLLAHSKNLTPADMLHIQTDIYSDFDRMLAERLTYALDHSSQSRNKTLRQAADLLRTFDGRMTIDSPAAAILSVVHTALWPALLAPKVSKFDNSLYTWGERDYALEQILMHTPARWLPEKYPNWHEFLAATVLDALNRAKAPANLATWRYGSIHTLDIEHPIFDQSEALKYLLGRPTGTGSQPQSGDGTTIKQVGHAFGPSERFTADFSGLDKSTLNIVLGQSANPDSPWFMDQFQPWYHGTTFPLAAPATHTLTLVPSERLNSDSHR